MAQICQTIVADSLAELRRQRDAVCDAEMVELRLDGVGDLDVAGALAGRTRPVLVTCRPEREGGRFRGAESDRLRFLSEAITLGAEYVDVEWMADRQGLPKCERTRLVLSHHQFSSMPSDVADRAAAMRREAPEAVIKVAVAVSSLSDVMRLRAIAGIGDRVLIGMGAAGMVTRVCPWLFGSAWTYAGTAAPGQLPAATLAHSYRVPSGSSSTRLFAITGAPLGHSASPAMHNAAFAALGIDAVYVPLETRDAREFLTCAEALGVEGASVTAPLKTSWPPVGVELDAEARTIGAANTLKCMHGDWLGTNFDAAGFVAPLHARGFAAKGARCVVLGAGGAARAAASALRDLGAVVEISARRQDAAASLARELGVGATAFPPANGWDLLVNATPVGTRPDRAAPIPQASVRGRVVYDLVYHPRETTLVQWARQADAEVIDGLEMLVHQACQQFKYWTGFDAPAGVMMRAAEEFLEADSTGL